MTIALCCPSRQRPELFNRMVNSAVNTAYDKNNVSVYLGVGDDDWPDYEKKIPDFIKGITTFPVGCPTVYKWNMIAIKQAMWNKHTHYMLAADDMIFTTPHWDRAILEHYDGLQNKIHAYSLRDSRDNDGTPHPIVTREYIEAMGYFLPPIFLHWFVDSWTIDIGRANSCFTHIKDYMLVHDKPFHRGEPDDTHMCIRRAGWLNSDQWTNEKCKHFLELEKERLRKHMLNKSVDVVASVIGKWARPDNEIVAQEMDM